MCYYCLVKAVFARLCKMHIWLSICAMLYLWQWKNKLLSREKNVQRAWNTLSLFLFYSQPTFFSLGVPTPKAISQVLQGVSERLLQSASCKLSKHTFKSNTFVPVGLKGRENEKYSHATGDTERGGEFTQLLKSSQIPSE